MKLYCNNYGPDSKKPSVNLRMKSCCESLMIYGGTIRGKLSQPIRSFVK